MLFLFFQIPDSQFFGLHKGGVGAVRLPDVAHEMESKLLLRQHLRSKEKQEKGGFQGIFNDWTHGVEVILTKQKGFGKKNPEALLWSICCAKFHICGET
jgi:hypothetical protein